MKLVYCVVIVIQLLFVHGSEKLTQSIVKELKSEEANLHSLKYVDEKVREEKGNKIFLEENVDRDRYFAVSNKKNEIVDVDDTVPIEQNSNIQKGDENLGNNERKIDKIDDLSLNYNKYARSLSRLKKILKLGDFIELLKDKWNKLLQNSKKFNDERLTVNSAEYSIVNSDETVHLGDIHIGVGGSGKKETKYKTYKEWPDKFSPAALASSSYIDDGSGILIVKHLNADGEEIDPETAPTWDNFDDEIWNSPGQYKILNGHGEQTGTIRVNMNVNGKTWGPKYNFMSGKSKRNKKSKKRNRNKHSE